jgi:hypothetical protein
MSIVVSGVLLILAGAGGTFGGLLVCSHLDLGFAFEDLRADVLKCLGVAAVVVALGGGLLWMWPNIRVIAPLPVVYYLAMKLSWLELEGPEILVAGLGALLAMGLAAAATMSWLVG